MDCDYMMGPADCLMHKCICKESFVTEDGSKCVRNGSLQLAQVLPKFQSGTCTGFDVPDGTGNCASVGKSVIQKMAGVGAAEPQEMPCPDDTANRTIDLLPPKKALGGEQFQLSLCRIAVQHYHGSPLPLVSSVGNKYGSFATDVSNPVVTDPKQNRASQLYSPQTLLQWRTSVIQLMTRMFVYSIVMKNPADGARRVGNMLHVLSGTFSKSRVRRKSLNFGSTDCSKQEVTLALSMDVTNRKINADAEGDEFYDCGVFYAKEALKTWASARVDGTKCTILSTVDWANKWGKNLVQDVLCPSMSISSEFLSKPAGGADEPFAAAFSQQEESSNTSSNTSSVHALGNFPSGLVAERDAGSMVEAWAKDLSIFKEKVFNPLEKFKYPDKILYPARGADVCQNPDLALVDSIDIEKAMRGELNKIYLVT
jgi:hypothetical protein